MKALTFPRAVGAACVALTLAALAAQPSQGAIDVAQADEAESTLSSTQLREEAQAPTQKDETVKVSVDAAGAVQDVTVQATLKNGDGSAALRDEADLSGVELSDDDDKTAFEQEGTTLYWDAQGDDVAYKGTSEKRPPVSMSISYTLDGQEVSPDELLGKSGRVVMTYRFTNESVGFGVSGASKVPFVCMSGITLPSDVFSNVSVDNGKVMDGSDSTVVVGIAMPGLQSSLGLGGSTFSDLDIPEEFSVTADVEGFELGQTVTYVSSDLLSDIDTGSLGLGDTSSQMSSLQEAMNTLVEGSDTLAQGLTSLAQGATALDGGLGQLQASTSKLPDATKSLSAGAAGVSDGLAATLAAAQGLSGQASAAATNAGVASQKAQAVSEGVSSSKKSLENLVADLQAIKSSLDATAAHITDETQRKAVEAESAKLYNQIASLQSAIDALPTQSAADAASAVGGLAAEDVAVAQTAAAIVGAAGDGSQGASGLTALSAGAAQVASGAAQMEQASGALSSGVSQLKQGSSQLAAGNAAAAQGNYQLSAGLRTFNEEGVSKIVEVFGTELGDVSGRLETTKQLGLDYTNFSGITQGTKGSVVFTYTTAAIE